MSDIITYYVDSLSDLENMPMEPHPGSTDLKVPDAGD